MTKDLDTSWFDLKNYEAFKPLSLDGWMWQFRVRQIYHKNADVYAAYKHSHSIPDDVIKRVSSMITNLKNGFIPGGLILPDGWEEQVSRELKKYPFSTTSVGSLLSSDLWEMAKNNELSHVWEACEHVNSFGVSDEEDNAMLEIASTPYDLLIKQYPHLDVEPEAHVVINLAATDEQIKRDFANWLTQYRQAVNYLPQKKSFTQADFDYWVEYGVMQYLDLLLIAKLEGQKITQNKLARLIFPDEYNVDIVERIRKVTKPTAEGLVKNNLADSLALQIVAEKVTGMKNTSCCSGKKSNLIYTGFKVIKLHPS